MKFELRHAFDCTPERLWEITDSDAFEARLAEATNATRELVERSETGGETYVRRRIAVKRDLPAAMVKVLGTDGIAYDQETRRKAGSNVLRWSIKPMVLQGRFSGEGETEVRPTPGGCERIIRGELVIRVPLVGGQMEKKLVDDVQASYTRAAELIRELLKAG